MKVVPVKQQPPIMVADLIAGAKYHLRVYSHELNSVSSKFVIFKTKQGETSPGPVDPGLSVGTRMVCEATATVSWGFVLKSYLVWQPSQTCTETSLRVIKTPYWSARDPLHSVVVDTSLEIMRRWL